MPDVRIGLCGFTMAFADYVREFAVVEVQQTFYEPPRDATLVRWRRQAPPGFEFTLKAWQLITHEASSPTYRRLRRPLSAGQRRECGSFRSIDTTVTPEQTYLRLHGVSGARHVHTDAELAAAAAALPAPRT